MFFKAAISLKVTLWGHIPMPEATPMCLEENEDSDNRPLSSSEWYKTFYKTLSYNDISSFGKTGQSKSLVGDDIFPGDKKIIKNKEVGSRSG